MKKFATIFLMLPCFAVPLCLMSCSDSGSADNDNDRVGDSFAKVTGIVLDICDEDNTFVDSFSTVTYDQRVVSLDAGERYIIGVDPLQSGGSACAVFIADGITWEYDETAVTITRRNADSEVDTKYYIEGIKTGETAAVKVQVDEYSLEFSVCFNEAEE